MTFPMFDVLLSLLITALVGGLMLMWSGLIGLRKLRPCRCGHPRDTHRHYRPGSDCGSCACRHYRPARRRRCRISAADAEWLASALDEHDCPLCDRPLAVHSR